MAAIDLGVATSVLATFLGSEPVTVGGTPEQKQRWITRIAEEGLLMAYGATEPDAGSDLAAMKTKATPVTENGHVRGYTLTGAKQWISNGGAAIVKKTMSAKATAAPIARERSPAIVQAATAITTAAILWRRLDGPLGTLIGSGDAGRGSEPIRPPPRHRAGLCRCAARGACVAWVATAERRRQWP